VAKLPDDTKPQKGAASEKDAVNHVRTTRVKTGMVPLAGIEPALLAELDFEFCASCCLTFPDVSCDDTKSLIGFTLP
jgi:hypothetical protein